METANPIRRNAAVLAAAAGVGGLGIGEANEPRHQDADESGQTN